MAVAAAAATSLASKKMYAKPAFDKLLSSAQDHDMLCIINGKHQWWYREAYFTFQVLANTHATTYNIDALNPSMGVFAIEYHIRYNNYVCGCQWHGRSHLGLGAILSCSLWSKDWKRLPAFI